MQLIKTTIAIKAIPGIDNIFDPKQFDLHPSQRDKNTVQIVYFIAKLLSIKADNEEKIYDSLTAIKKHFWSLGMQEMKFAFEMYADGDLDLEPRSNHIDRILVGQIFRAYKAQLPKPKKTISDELVLSDEEKRMNEIHSATICFDFYAQNGYLDPNSLYLYKVLLDKFKFKKKEIEVMIEKSKEIEGSIHKQRAYYKNLSLRKYFDRLLAKGEHLKDII